MKISNVIIFQVATICLFPHSTFGRVINDVSLNNNLHSSDNLIENSTKYKAGFTCGSLCAGNYDVCVNVIKTFTEKLLCIRISFMCRFDCQNDVSMFQERNSTPTKAKPHLELTNNNS